MQVAAPDRTGTGYVVGVAVAYFLLAAMAIAFTRLSSNVALLWIANAPLLAALLTRPVRERRWHVMACYIASVSATTCVSPYAPLSPLLGLANIGEALIAFALLRQFGAGARPFESLLALGIFAAVAGIAAPIASGTVPSVALWLFQGTPPLVIWSNWIVGHGLGALIGTPVALLLLGGAAYREPIASRRKKLRALWVSALLLGVTGLCFAQTGLPLLFLPILPLIVAAMAFRLTGAALGVFAIALIGASLTVAGHGPIQLIARGEGLHLQFFQFYLGVLFLIAMPFATMIAEKKQLASDVAESEARYRLIAEYASDAVLVLDAAGDVLFASPAVREVGGYDPAALLGRSCFTLVSEPDRERMRLLHGRTLNEADRVHRAEFRAITATGTMRWFELTARAVRERGGESTSVVTIIRDLSQRKAREADLERQATTDSMTGVLNRRAFQKRLAELPHAEFGDSGALALLDLDHFKAVNDSHGHAAGDAALLHFADVMRSKLRSEDMIGRLGGEEFAVMFPGIHPSAALAACERVRAALADEEIVTPHGRFRVTVSIGLAPICAGMLPEAILRQADAALYRAKAAGRNRSEMADA